jgi:hypothetical protein
MSAKCTMKARVQDDGNIAQDWSVHGGSWGPMFRYYLNAIDKAYNGDLHGMHGKGRRVKRTI